MGKRLARLAGACTVVVLATLSASSAAFASTPAPVATWGPNEYGQLGDSRTAAEQLYSDAPVAVSGITEAVAIAEGGQFDLALLENGSVKAWGRNNHGQLGGGTQEPLSDTPVTVPGLEHVKEIAAGDAFSMARTEADEVYVWGEWPAGLGGSTPHNVGLTSITHIAAGDGVNDGSDAYAVSSVGTVYAWGFDGQWQLGYPEPERDMSVTPLPVEHLAGASAGIAAGGRFAASLTTSGGLEIWGGNHFGEHGDGGVWPYGEAECFGDYESCAAPNERAPSTASLSEVAGISASKTYALALKRSGEAFAWGSSPAFSSGSPTRVATEVTAVATRNGHSTVLLRNNTLETWGTNVRGSLGDGVPSGPESCTNEEVERSEPCERAPREVTGFTEAPTRLGAALALAKAPGPTVRVLEPWKSSGSLAIAKLGVTIPLSGTFHGRQSRHGQAGGELGTSTGTVNAKLFGLVPITLEERLARAPSDGGPDARTSVHVSAVGILGLVLSSNCTSEAFTMSTELPVENGVNRLEGMSGSATIPAFHCDGGFLNEPFGSVLSSLLSGAGNSYTLVLEA